MFRKIKEWYGRQSDTTKAFIWIGLICIIGIIIRWKAVLAGIAKTAFNSTPNNAI